MSALNCEHLKNASSILVSGLSLLMLLCVWPASIDYMYIHCTYTYIRVQCICRAINVNTSVQRFCVCACIYML